jgi:hypothetical protein
MVNGLTSDTDSNSEPMIKGLTSVTAYDKSLAAALDEETLRVSSRPMTIECNQVADSRHRYARDPSLITGKH